MSIFIACLYGTVIEVNYLFHAEFAENYLFEKYYSPPPWRLNGAPLTIQDVIPQDNRPFGAGEFLLYDLSRHFYVI